MVVPDAPDYAFLCAHLGNHAHACARDRRIRAKKLRGVWSMGMLMPAPDGLVAGDNAIDAMGIVRYEPPLREGKGQSFGICNPHRPPPGIDYEYGVENGRRNQPFADGEPVAVTEKIHGCNARYSFRDGEMYAGSHRRWLKPDASNMWWRVLAQYPEIRAFCEANPGFTVYGEIYGTQDLRYGLENGKIGFVAFDVMKPDGRWMEYEQFRAATEIMPVVPELAIVPYSADLIMSMVDGRSSLADHIQEGIVIKPLTERWDERVGRVIVKLVSNQYMERAK
jgi:RNA ligase (TIGR02306 family)